MKNIADIATAGEQAIITSHYGLDKSKLTETPEKINEVSDGANKPTMKTYEIRAGYESHVWDTKAATLEAGREKAKGYITELHQHGPWGQSGSYIIEEYTNGELTLVVEGGIQRGKWWEV